MFADADGAEKVKQQKENKKFACEKIKSFEKLFFVFVTDFSRGSQKNKKSLEFQKRKTQEVEATQHATNSSGGV